MNKQTIITLLLILITATGWAQKVWNNPGYRNEPHGFQFDVNEVEFRKDETVLHITVKNHPGAKFSFGSCTVLKTEDMSYPIVSAKSSLTLLKVMHATSLKYGTSPTLPTKVRHCCSIPIGEMRKQAIG